MKNPDLVQSLRQIFLQDELTFIIPAYQRGYKWTKEHVRHLLNSIESKLMICQNGDQYFCLQNITLCDSEEGLRVVDGQQRLITLTLILSQLKVKMKSRIKFPTREKTEAFINNLVSNHELSEADSLDEEYISEAVQTIHEWFETNQLSLDLFLDKVKLIVNIVENEATTEEQTFANLNGVKSELDGSDLLRAIFITRCETETETERLLGAEFDEMNKWCKEEENRKFITKLVEVNKIIETQVDKLGSYHARITFDEKRYPIDLIYKLFFVLNRNENEEYNYIFFEKLLSEANCRKVLEELRLLFSALKVWMTDRTIYHFLGFLIFNTKGYGFSQIYEWWKAGRDKFLLQIKSAIRKSLTTEFREDYSLTDLGNERHPWYLGHFDDDGRMGVLIHILILQDVLLCARHPEVGYLPVDYFTRMNDDVEHIACQTPNEKDSNDRERWQLYIDAMKDLAVSMDDNQLREDIRALETATNAEDAMSVINKYGLNSAGNLVLLEKGLNRGYGNSVFESKREQVIEAYFQNGKHRRRYIRPYTLKVFLSSTNKGGLSRWTFEDFRNNTHRLFEETRKWIEEQ